MPRLRADLWCAAFVRRHNDRGGICVVARRGDASAGQILIEIDHLDGTASLFVPAPAMLAEESGDGRRFARRFARVDPAEVRERIAREIGFDPDLWHLVLESRADDPGIEVVGD